MAAFGDVNMLICDLVVCLHGLLCLIAVLDAHGLERYYKYGILVRYRMLESLTIGFQHI
jgi:hypothetical protein